MCRHRFVSMLIIAVAAAAPLAAPYRACAALPFFDSDTEQSLFDRAKKASDDGFYDVSIRQFNRFLKKYAQSPLAGDALLLLSHAYLSSARYGEAMDCSRKLIDGDGPLKEKGMLILADALFRKGDYDAALSACAEAVAAFPDGAQKELILLIEGKCRYAQRRYDAALESFGAIARRQEPAKDPVMIDARIEMVKSYCCLGDYAAAEESAKALRQLPLTVRQRAEAGYWNGLLMSVTERHAEAAKAFEEILSLKQSATDVPDVLYRLGLSYARSGKYDAADGAFERVTAEYPKSRYYLPALIQRARVRILAGKYDDALQFIEKNLAKKRGEPYDGVAALLAAMAHQSRRDNAQAEKYFKRALKLSSDPGVRSQAFAGLGETLFGGNDFAGAIAQFAAASAVEPDPLRQIVIRSRIADAHLALRQYREALDTLVALLGERAADITESQKAGLLLNAGIASSELGD
ncbi:MAG TPA: tetratricopeptide repeat protein, partial [bacterium]|nr:tetratricopeptide repeat protein [bacterium]